MAKEIDYNEEPSTYPEAVNCDDSGRWMTAMQEVIESLPKNDAVDNCVVRFYSRLNVSVETS